MLKHRTIVLLTSLLLIVLIIMDVKRDVHVWLYPLVIILFLGIEFYGSAYITSNFHLNAISRGNNTKKYLAITFDDGPSENTGKVLDTLRELDVKATFFCIGKNIPGREGILRKVTGEGHLIGNHSFSHSFWFDLKTKMQMTKEIQKADESIKSVIGKKPLLFRPPYGVTTPAMGKSIAETKHVVIGWNIRSLDTTGIPKREMLTRIKKKLVPGSIILLHDHVNGTELVLKDLVSMIRTNGYEIIPLDELLNIEAYA
jgi:peptidoglycan/xylan/chitin deacetylase (PgdA/CDA1 family)